MASRPLPHGLLDTTLGFHLARASVLTDAAFERWVGRPHQLRKVDYSLLMILADRGHLAPKQIIGLLSLTAPKLSMVMERMQQRGLIGRSPDPADRRSVQVALTPQGLRMAQTLGPAAQRMEQALRKRLSSADHAALIRMLRQLTDGSDGNPPAQRSPDSPTGSRAGRTRCTLR